MGVEEREKSLLQKNLQLLVGRQKREMLMHKKKIELAEKLESPRLEDCGSSKNTSNVPNPIMCSHHITMMKSFVDNLKNGEVDEVVG